MSNADLDAQLVSQYVNALFDPFDNPQLAQVIRTCKVSVTISEAGRQTEMSLCPHQFSKFLKGGAVAG